MIQYNAELLMKFNECGCVFSFCGFAQRLASAFASSSLLLQISSGALYSSPFCLLSTAGQVSFGLCLMQPTTASSGFWIRLLLTGRRTRRTPVTPTAQPAFTRAPRLTPPTRPHNPFPAESSCGIPTCGRRPDHFLLTVTPYPVASLKKF